MDEHLINIEYIGTKLNKFSGMLVKIFKCRLCGFETEGENLIDFHVIFQCKKKIDN